MKKIAIICEGKTEKTFLGPLRNFLSSHLSGKMPKLIPFSCDGRIPTDQKLKSIVQTLLSGKDAVNHVIALTDVYTGKKINFINAEDAKKKMRKWVGEEPRFHPHAAQYDFEAWLLPYWPTIQNLAGHKQAGPKGNPEKVNHNKPPSFHIKEIFNSGKQRKYNKQRDAGRILKENKLSVSISQCAELKAFVNTILSICEGHVIP